MRVEWYDGQSGGLVIAPETYFEEEWLRTNFPAGVTCEAFLKTGLTPSETIGLKVKPPSPEQLPRKHPKPPS